MIHYSCDCCKQPLESNHLRYVVRMEVYAAMEPSDAIDAEDDRENLEELEEIISRNEDADSDRIGEDIYQQMRFDLCSQCRKKFLENPIVREPAKQFNFSEN